jgi:hypothetical protein
MKRAPEKFGSCAFLTRDDPFQGGAIERGNSGQSDQGNIAIESHELKEILIFSLKAF